MQVDNPTKLLNTCVCGRKPDHYTIGYSRTPFYAGCVCGKLVDGFSTLDELIEAWNNDNDA